MQTTAMNEPVFLCQMIWSALFLMAYLRGLGEGNQRLAGRAIVGCGVVLVTAIYTRYDGWIFAFIVWLIAVHALWRSRAWKSPVGGAFVLFTAMLITAPVLWFAWNARQYGDWLDFMRGPYSAKAIEIRTATPGAPHYPGWHSIHVAALYYIKSAELGAVPSWWGNRLLFLTVAGSIAALVKWRKQCLGPLFLFWMPLPFYAYSVAWGSVPIFIPLWWPHSWYNTRYGMELLPALALGLGFVARLIIGAVHDFKPAWAKLAAAALFVLVALNAGQLLRERPLAYVEGTKNIDAHRPYQLAIPPVLRSQLAEHPGAICLMETSVDPEIVALTGIPLRQTINEADLSIWDEALKAPAAHASIVLAFDGDPVDRAVKAHPEGLTAVAHFTAPGQPSGTMYVSGTPQSSNLNSGPASVVASGKATM
jgi:hypothetical protein